MSKQLKLPFNNMGHPTAIFGGRFRVTTAAERTIALIRSQLSLMVIFGAAIRLC